MAKKKSPHDPNDPLAPVLDLFDQLSELEKSHADLTAKATQWSSEKSQLIKEGDIEDNETFKILTTVGLKLEIAEAKLPQIEAQIEAIQAEFQAAIEQFCDSIAPIVRARKEKNEADVAVELGKYLDKVQAERLAPECVQVKPHLNIWMSLGSYRVKSGLFSPITRARQLVTEWREYAAAYPA
jgi:hypothetical protein